MIKLKSLILEKTLYHGTLIDNVPSISRFGLMPTVGNFVKDAYDLDGYEGIDPESYLQDLVFATDKEQLDKSVTAITAQIAKKLNKSFHDVTDQEFIRYGAIAKVNDGEYYFQHRTRNDDKEHPYTVEPGDYYSNEYVGVDEILTGVPMLRLLKRYGLWPRIYFSSKINNEKDLKNLLIKLALKYHNNVPKEDVIKKVLGIKSKDILQSKISSYKQALGYKND